LRFFGQGAIDVIDVIGRDCEAITFVAPLTVCFCSNFRNGVIDVIDVTGILAFGRSALMSRTGLRGPYRS
jgi:hypothetical protein